jgi:hypothetical protein
VSRLQRLGQAGFRAVLDSPMLDRGPEQILAYVDAAQAAGLQVIWPLHSLDFAGSPPDGTNLVSQAWGQACGCRTNQDLLAYVVSLARSRSNTWGYYIADEPGPEAHERVRSLVERVRALDPAHPRLVVGCGICGSEDPRSHISFLADLDIVLGSDAYPVNVQAPSAEAAYADVTQKAAALRSAAAPTGRGNVMVLQSWRWGDSISDSQAAGLDAASTRFPVQQEIQAQRDAAIKYAQPDLILWFMLTQVIGWPAGQRPPNWAEPPDPQQRWNNLVLGAFAPLPDDEPPSAVPSGGEPKARKPVARFTVRVLRPPARIGSRVDLDARASYDPSRKRLRYRWTLNGRRLAKCRSRRCSFRPHRSGTQRIALRVDNGAQTASAVRRLRVRRMHRRSRRTRVSIQT